jgi:hypothetical protein
MSKVQLQGNVSGTGVFTIASPNSNTDRTLTLPDNTGTVITTGSTGGVSQAMLASGIASNGPAFMATDGGASQSCANNTNVKLTFTSEQFDTNSCYDAPNSRFTPNVAGYYVVFTFFGGQTPSTQNQAWTTMVYKNGSLYGPGTSNNVVTMRNAIDWGSLGVRGQQLVYCNGTTDYIEIYAYQYDYSAGASKNAVEKVFGGYMVRAA